MKSVGVIHMTFDIYAKKSTRCNYFFSFVLANKTDLLARYNDDDIDKNIEFQRLGDAFGDDVFCKLRL